jgi:hypothetical protein
LTVEMNVKPDSRKDTVELEADSFGESV